MAGGRRLSQTTARLRGAARTLIHLCQSVSQSVCESVSLSVNDTGFGEEIIDSDTSTETSKASTYRALLVAQMVTISPFGLSPNVMFT